MSLETGTYISDLVTTNPSGSDVASDGAGHLRLVKSTIKSTFPNVTGAVTSSHTDLNRTVPIGTIVIWYGTEASVPSGWTICDGVAVTRTDGGGSITPPNLQAKFIQGTTKGGTPGTTSTFATSGNFSSYMQLFFIMRY